MLSHDGITIYWTERGTSYSLLAYPVASHMDSSNALSKKGCDVVAKE